MYYKVLKIVDTSDYTLVNVKDKEIDSESFIPFLIYLFDSDSYISIEKICDYELTYKAYIDIIENNLEDINNFIYKDEIYSKNYYSQINVILLDEYAKEFILKEEMLHKVECFKRECKINKLLSI